MNAKTPVNPPSRRSGSPAQKHEVALADAVTISASRLHCMENIGPVQFAPAVPAHRWTGPGHSFGIFVPIKRSQPLCLVLECLESASEHNWHNVFMEADDAMQLCRYRPSNGRHLLIADLPERKGATSATLRFHLQETRRRERLKGIEETNGPLGLCLVSVTIGPQND
jgi:hypothetical protein